MVSSKNSTIGFLLILSLAGWAATAGAAKSQETDAGFEDQMLRFVQTDERWELRTDNAWNKFRLFSTGVVDPKAVANYQFATGLSFSDTATKAALEDLANSKTPLDGMLSVGISSRDGEFVPLSFADAACGTDVSCTANALKAAMERGFVDNGQDGMIDVFSIEGNAYQVAAGELKVIWSGAFNSDLYKGERIIAKDLNMMGFQQ